MTIRLNLLRTVWYVNVDKSGGDNENVDKIIDLFKSKIETAQADLDGMAVRENLYVPVFGQPTHSITDTFVFETS